MSTYLDTIARPPKTLTDREETLLLRTSGSHVDGWRDHCMLSLMFDNGLRQLEIVALNVGDVFDAEGRARRRILLRRFKGSEKTPKPPPQEIVLSDAVRAKLERLYQLRVRAGENLRPKTPLFMSRNRRRISRRQVRRLFDTWQTRAGLDRHYNQHCARHTACNKVYRLRRDVRVTQVFARHKKLTSTQIYTHPTVEDLFEAVAAINRC